MTQGVYFYSVYIDDDDANCRDLGNLGLEQARIWQTLYGRGHRSSRDTLIIPKLLIYDELEAHLLMPDSP